MATNKIVITGTRHFGDYFEQPLGFQTVNADGSTTAMVLSDYGFDAPIVSNGYLKTSGTASITLATAGDLAAFDYPNESSYSWLMFKIAADTITKIPAKAVVREYRLRAKSVANPAVNSTLIILRITEK